MKTLFNFLLSFVAYAVALCSGAAPSVFTRRDPCAGADVYSAEYTNAYMTTPPAKLSAAQQGGRVRIFRATYTQGAVIGNVGDIIYFGKLPAGATRVPGGAMFWGTGTANSTLKVGLVGADADMCAATAIDTAGTVALNVFAAAGAVSKLTAETAIIGTVATAGVKAGQVITVWQPYVMND